MDPSDIPVLTFLALDALILVLGIGTVVANAILAHKCPDKWTLFVPPLALAAHFAVFYVVALNDRLNGFPFDNLFTIIWSTVLGLHGIITSIFMTYIIWVEFKCNGRLKS